MKSQRGHGPSFPKVKELLVIVYVLVAPPWIYFVEEQIYPAARIWEFCAIKNCSNFHDWSCISKYREQLRMIEISSPTVSNALLQWIWRCVSSADYPKRKHEEVKKRTIVFHLFISYFVFLPSEKDFALIHSSCGLKRMGLLWWVQNIKRRKEWFFFLFFITVYFLHREILHL